MSADREAFAAAIKQRITDRAGAIDEDLSQAIDAALADVVVSGMYLPAAKLAEGQVVLSVRLGLDPDGGYATARSWTEVLGVEVIADAIPDDWKPLLDQDGHRMNLSEVTHAICHPQDHTGIRALWRGTCALCGKHRTDHGDQDSNHRWIADYKETS